MKHGLSQFKHLRMLIIAALGVALAAMFGSLPAAKAGNIIVVNVNIDSVGNNGNCTLREAIIAANTNTGSGANINECAAGSAVGADTIQIKMNGGAGASFTLNVSNTLGALPTITEAVIIDGTAMEGYTGKPLFIVDGGAVVASPTHGLTATVPVTIKGVNIVDFTGNCINLSAGANGSVIDSNWLGMANDNFNQDGCTGSGLMLSGVTGVTVQNNVLSGNTEHGLFLNAGSGHQILNNRIGTNSIGDIAVGNQGNGIHSQGSNNLTISGNTISGNTDNGIELSHADGALITGNFVGMQPDGGNFGNGGHGIAIFGDSDNNVIGGDTVAERNVISMNFSNGILVQFLTTSPENTTIQGNYIGMGLDGLLNYPNGASGIEVTGTINTIIGGSNPGEGNLISGNTGDGIILFSGGTPGTTVEGNIIGPDAAGTGDMGNGGSGIRYPNAGTATVTDVIADNVISGNDSNGIQISNITGVSIHDNLIGVQANGAPMPNAFSGITLFGGSAQIADNWIGNHSANAIGLANTTAALIAGSTGNCIIGNLGGVGSSNPTIQVFENNWWGDVTGPSGDGAGIGDPAFDVDFDPFLTSAPTICTSSILKNGSFEDDTLSPALLPDFWTLKKGVLNGSNDGQVCNESFAGNCSMKIVGNGNTKQLIQALDVIPSGSAGDNFTLKFYEKTWGLSGGGKHMMTLRITNTDGSKLTQNITLPASGGADWTEYSTAVTTTKPYKKIEVILKYGKSTGIIWLDAVSLAKTPSAPSNLVAITGSDTVIQLDWTDNSDDEFRFVIEHSNDGFTGWTVLDTVSPNTETYLHMGLTCNTKHFYRIAAVNGAGQSAYSNVGKAYTQQGGCGPIVYTNLLLNQSFEDDVLTPLLLPDSWGSSNLTLGALTDGMDCLTPAPSFNCSMRIVGNSGTMKRIKQTVTIAGTQFDDILIKFQATTDSVPVSGTRRVLLKVTYTDGSSETFTFLPDLVGSLGWNQYSFNADVAKPYSKVELIFEFKSSGTVRLDDFLLAQN
jgi:CSLREA domain-containing protein